MSARDEFEAWRRHTLAELARERDGLIAQRAKLRPPPPERLSGAVGEELLRGLEDFLRRYSCVEGSLELVRHEIPVVRYSEVLYAQRADGRPDTFFDFMKEPFARRAKQLLDEQAAAGVLRVRVDLAKGGSEGGSEATLLAGAALELSAEASRLELFIQRLEKERAALEALVLSHEPYGRELASRVVRALKRESLSYNHRDYCGLGLFATPDGGFVYARVWDGGFADTHVERRFKDEEQLTHWLAQQSDASLSDYGGFRFRSQTLTRERLEAFAPR
jgi:hypothetical protein